MTISIQDLSRRIVSLLDAQYSGWSGFGDPAFVEEEIDYKRAASRKAKELLGEPAFSGLLQRGDYEEVFRRLFEVGDSTNLLFKGVPKSGDLGVLLVPDIDKAALSTAIYALLHGTGESSTRLQSLVDFLHSRGLPTKWTFPTYFLFLLHPEIDIFVKPTPFKWLLSQLGDDEAIGSVPTGAVYDRIRRIALSLREELADRGASDMIDVQSAIWVAASRDAAKSSVGYWKIAPGEQAKLWPEWKKNGYAAIGWGELGDLSGLSQSEFIRRRDQAIAAHPSWTKSGINQVWEFYKMAIGDRVVANRGMSMVVGVGTVTGPPYFAEGEPYPHRVPVRWDDINPRAVDEGGWRRTLLRLDEKKFNAISRATEAPEAPAEGPPLARQAPRVVSEPGPTPPEFSYTAADLAEATGYDVGTIAGWRNAMERKKQVIFYGPPGTGKTFIAQRFAKLLAAGGDGFIETVQFHPSYGYEDFMQGIRPQAAKGGGLEYPLMPGRFMEFCRRAADRKGACVLIIDEINRANLSRVFGELMYLLEYRDESIHLASGGEFKIPGSVRIIGTMNTADRSIALVDHALRRRFSFLPLRPEYDVLRRFHRDGVGDAVARVLQRVNQTIGDPHYEIGISYFMLPNLVVQIESIWRVEIEPYLEEYFSDSPSKMSELRWETVGPEFSAVS